MRVGILGDIHGNLAALDATLEALTKAGAESFVCTGDVVGYGPSPAECIQRLRERNIPSVLGNHDLYVSDVFSKPKEKIESDTWATIEWTRNCLSVDDLKWLASLPQRLDLEHFTVVHGSLAANPWSYLLNRPNLEAHFAKQTTHLVVCGHTHLPLMGVHHADGMLTMDFLRSGPLPASHQVVINPGSVGQPRDRDPRSASCLYDSATGSVQMVRVPYDIAATQGLMRQAGIALRFIHRLEIGH